MERYTYDKKTGFIIGESIHYSSSKNISTELDQILKYLETYANTFLGEGMIYRSCYDEKSNIGKLFYSTINFLELEKNPEQAIKQFSQNNITNHFCSIISNLEQDLISFKADNEDYVAENIIIPSSDFALKTLIDVLKTSNKWINPLTLYSRDNDLNPISHLKSELFLKHRLN